MESSSRPVYAICYRILTAYQLELLPQFPGSHFRRIFLAATENLRGYRVGNFGMTYKYFTPAICSYPKLG